MGLAALARHMKGKEDKIAVVVGTITDDVRLIEVPAMKVCALRTIEIIAEGDTLTVNC